MYRAGNEADGHSVADQAADPQVGPFDDERGAGEDRQGRHVGDDRRQCRSVYERQGQGVFVHNGAEHCVEDAHAHVHGEGGAHSRGAGGRLHAKKASSEE